MVRVFVTLVTLPMNVTPYVGAERARPRLARGRLFAAQQLRGEAIYHRISGWLAQRT